MSKCYIKVFYQLNFFMSSETMRQLLQANAAVLLEKTCNLGN